MTERFYTDPNVSWENLKFENNQSSEEHPVILRFQKKVYKHDWTFEMHAFFKFAFKSVQSKSCVIWCIDVGLSATHFRGNSVTAHPTLHCRLGGSIVLFDGISSILWLFPMQSWLGDFHPDDDCVSMCPWMFLNVKMIRVGKKVHPFWRFQKSFKKHGSSF